MTTTQRDAARAYVRARADVHRLDPETLAHAAAVCAADLARERYWTALALARSATRTEPAA